MTDIVHGKPRDAMLVMITKAITTGTKRDERKSPRDQGFFAGRVTGYINSAAILAERMYGCDYELTRKVIGDAVRVLRELPAEDRRKKEAVQAYAERILTTALLEA